MEAYVLMNLIVNLLYMLFSFFTNDPPERPEPPERERDGLVNLAW